MLQKLAYLLLIFVLLAADRPDRAGRCRRGSIRVLPGWVDLLGGRQSARTLHFIAAWLLVLFVLIHVFEVIVTGFWNNLRSMITGRYRISSEEQP